MVKGELGPAAMCALNWSHCNHVLRRFLGNANNFNDIIYKEKRREAGVTFECHRNPNRFADKTLTQRTYMTIAQQIVKIADKLVEHSSKKFPDVHGCFIVFTKSALLNLADDSNVESTLTR